MNRYWLLGLVVMFGCAESSDTMMTSGTSDTTTSAMQNGPVTSEAGYTFAAPVLLTAGGQPISVESPGFACPTVADVDQDGDLDLVVGQFNEGGMQLFENQADASESPKLVAAGWLKTDDQRAVVPGVW